MARPSRHVERRDVIEIINETIDRDAVYQAHNLLGHVRSFFNWAIATEDYGLEHSPCDRIRPKVLIGERKPRQRVLDDAELGAFWRAAERMGFAYGPLLLLTGCRKSEIGAARWREIDADKPAHHSGRALQVRRATPSPAHRCRLGNRGNAAALRSANAL